MTLTQGIDNIASATENETIFATNPSFLLIYGTQTGQSKAIAEEVTERADKLGLHADLHCFGKIEKEFNLEKQSLVVFITSTTGDGEPPDTVQKFWRRIKRRTLSRDYFCNLRYSLLGLGDSNYSNFCNCAKMIDVRLKELGAQTFIASKFADDAHGLEVVVEPWIDELLSFLQKHFSLAGKPEVAQHIMVNVQELKISTQSDQLATVDKTEIGATEVSEWQLNIPQLKDDALQLPVLPSSFLQISKLENSSQDINSQFLQNNCKLPFAASTVQELPVVSIRKLTKDSSIKRTYLIELDNCEKKIEFEAGDTVGMLVENNPQEVAWLINKLDLKSTAEEVIQIMVNPDTTKKRARVPEFLNNPSTLKDLFSHCLDIRHTPKKAFLRLLSEHTTDESEKRQLQVLSSKQGAHIYSLYIQEERRGFINILSAFKTCKPPAVLILENLPRLLPRPYSATSSPFCGKLCFAFNVLDLPNVADITDRKGLATGFMESLTNLSSDQLLSVKVYARTHQTFRLPDDVTVPLILIGPGTGVAPFIGFLQQRELMLKSGADIGDIWLFFGNRHRNLDFLFQEELTAYQESGVLTHLHTCFSRDSGDKYKYVTNLMREQAAELAAAIMDRGAYIYVCGDAKNMAKDVTQALSDIVQQQKELTDDEVITVMKELRDQKRYKEDVWT